MLRGAARSSFSPQHARLPRFRSAADMYAHMRALTAAGGAGEYTVRNYLGVIEDMSSPEAALVETELFPRGALEFYTRKNMGWEFTEADSQRWLSTERGGAQGDYREGMQHKIANAIDCLRTHPDSKRATIPIPFAIEGSGTIDWRDAGQTKCCRELYLYIEEFEQQKKLCCSAVLRMQNASIFPKNIHFFATLLHHVASELECVGVTGVGEYTHFIANLCHDRSASNC